MPPKGSKCTKKNSFIGSLSGNKKISELEIRIAEQSRRTEGRKDGQMVLNS